jgi:hypothetical protein
MLYIVYLISTVILGLCGSYSIFTEQYPVAYMMFCLFLFNLATYIKEKG